MQSSQAKIVYAEDNEVNREVASARLRRAGHDVSATVDGSAALDLWRTKEFDVAILDIQMPIMDGLSVATAIRAEEQARGRRRTSLLALTAMTQELDRARCEAAGFDAYLAKPIKEETLLQQLQVCQKKHLALLLQREGESVATLLAALPGKVVMTHGKQGAWHARAGCCSKPASRSCRSAWAAAFFKDFG